MILAGDADHELYHRDLPDGRAIAVVPIFFGARVTIGEPGPFLDDQW